jgi:RHS repeat-associated protein
MKRGIRAVGKIGCRVGALCLLLVTFGDVNAQTPTNSSTSFSRFGITVPAHTSGQAVTLLPDGRWFLSGGGNPAGALIQIEDLSGTTPLVQGVPVALAHARSGHTATVLPDGTILIVGGTAPDGSVVNAVELFDPATQAIQTLPDTGLTARTLHTATLLTNGMVLIAGGLSAQGTPIELSELYNSKTQKAEPMVATLQTARSDHQAALLANGSGLVWGGKDASGKALENGELYDPAQQRFNSVEWWDETALPGKELTQVAPQLSESVPEAAAIDVPIDSRIAVRFSEPVRVQSVNNGSVTLVGPAGAVSGKVVAAEAGLLTFFTPKTELSPGTVYTLFLNGVTDTAGRALPFSSFNFTTHRFKANESGTGGKSSASIADDAAEAAAKAALRNGKPIVSVVTTVRKPTAPEQDDRKKPDADDLGPEDWIPSEQNRHGNWQVLGLSKDPQLLPGARFATQLKAALGNTSLSGQIARLNGLPLAGVPVSIGSNTAISDAQGRFLLSGLPVGVQTLQVDGSAVLSGGRHYTKHFIQVTLVKGKTTSMQGTIYLPRVDPATEVSIASPMDKELVLTHPAMPGLEVHIPKGAILRGYDGKVVTTLSITPIPVDRAPYPAPINFSVYFTLQPGGAFVDGDPSKAVKIVYPNYQGLPAGSLVNFWNYDPGNGGWKVYGQGKVSPDGKKVIPNKGIGFRQVMTFGYGLGGGPIVPPLTGPIPGGCDCGDPVDIATGLFTHSVTDIAIPDVIPISVERTYRQNDTTSRAFGIGANLSYAMYLYPADGNSPPHEVDLILADGGRIHFALQSGDSITDAVWVNSDSPTSFNGAKLAADTVGHHYVITMRDRSILTFASDPPNQLESYMDRNGNVLTITLSGGASGNITRVTSPNGRFVSFGYDGSNRITSATDNLGRSVGYTYGAPNCAGCLWKVTDMDLNVEQYGYDTSSRMTTITDKRTNVVTTNVYDANSRVFKQTLGDGTFWQFVYTLDGSGNVTQTTVNDPRTYVNQFTLNTSGFVTQAVLAQGQSVQQTYTYQRDSNNRVQFSTDAKSRTTAFGYDTVGDITSVTRLYGTAGAVTDSYTYDPTYNQLTSHTDALNHTTQFGLDPSGNLVSITDPLQHTISIVRNSMGLPTTITDALSDSTQIGYQQADVYSVTDALSRTAKVFKDGVGRPLSSSDPLGFRTQYSFDNMNRLQQITDPIGGLTPMTYDANGNLKTVRDPRTVGTHTYGYDSRNRLQTYTDPLTHSQSYVYDGLNNLTQYTDRKGQITLYGYDPLNRLHTITYQDGSTVTITWDTGNRPIQAVDSANGTIGWQFDDLDRLKQETTPQGVVNYTYYDNDLRQSMTAANQAQQFYCYDVANRLMAIVTGACSAPTTTLVAYVYDNANRRTSVTLPNGMVEAYGYDAANELKTTTYKSAAGISQGSITYGLDTNGRRFSRASTIDTGGISASPATSYNADNEIINFNGSNYIYDLNGNLTSDGTNTYTWNARNQLVSISGGVSASFAYDAMGRRQSRTVGGATVQFLYDGINVVRESSPSATIADYLTGLNVDEVYSRTDSSGTMSYLTDGLGSVIKLATSAGALSTSYSYDPYGKTTTSGAVSANPFQYAGRENDGTGLYYYRARYYSPKLGSFISEDPIGLAAGINTYAYVGGDPISLTDPDGLQQTRPGRPGIPCLWCIYSPPQPGQPMPPIFGSKIDPCLLDFANCVNNGLGANGTTLGGRIYDACHSEDNDEKCEQQYEQDQRMCKMTTMPGTGPRARCWASAAERYGACRAGRPIPPLVTW